MTNKDWNVDNKEAFTALIDSSEKKQDKIRILAAQVAHSTGGRQNFYLRDLYWGQHNSCDMSEDNTIVIAKFDNQPVKMRFFCTSFSDSEQLYAYASPETQKGSEYVVRLFKQKIGFVKVEFHGLTGNIPATGFANAWNLAGGSAI